jgi:hypothetical protein
MHVLFHTSHNGFAIIRISLSCCSNTCCVRNNGCSLRRISTILSARFAWLIWFTSNFSLMCKCHWRIAHSYQKLSCRFFGPYKIQCAYKLELPPHARIHNVVHVSQLKKHIPSDTLVSTDMVFIHPDTSLIPTGCL